MGPFDVIDSDTHVDENDETWSYIDDDLAAHRPVHGTFDDPQCVRDYWLVAGTKQHKAKRSDVVTKTTHRRIRRATALGVRASADRTAESDAPIRCLTLLRSVLADGAGRTCCG
jgi:hypothetical protein